MGEGRGEGSVGGRKGDEGRRQGRVEVGKGGEIGKRKKSGKYKRGGR